MAEFKDRLKELRTAKGISQQELADMLNVHAMTISGYERGIRRPNFEMLDEIADYFDVSVDYLIGNATLIEHYPRHGDAALARRLTAYASRIMAAYEKASPDTQAAVRAILHVED
jgi:transcriptional regulator with XRE-family HTH domain